MLVVGAEVRLDHGRIRLHLGRRPARDLPTEAEDVHVVGDAHDEVHVVLDEEHGELEVVADLLDEDPELGDLLVVQPAGRLVEEEQPRLGDERPSKLHALLDPVRQRRRRKQRPLAEPDDVEHLQRLGLPHLPPASVRADEHVLEHGHRPEELDVLERARYALAHDLVRGCLEDRRAVEQHLAGVRPVEARDDVEGRRLAGAVRPDEARDVSLLDLERHAVERDDSAEAQGDVPYLEEGHPHETLNGSGVRWQRSAGGLAQTRMPRLGARSRTDQSCTTDPAGTRTLTESTPRAFVTRVPPSQLQPPLRRIRRR